MQTRHVEKAAPALSRPAGGSVSYTCWVWTMWRSAMVEFHMVLWAGMCLLVTCQCLEVVTRM